MKRYEIWLGVVLGLTGGLLLGFFLGQSVSEGPAKNDGGRVAEKAPAVESGNAASTASTEPSARDWFKRQTSQFESAAQNQATPGIVEAISEALRADPPFNEARMILLMEMMRKEDFPLVLEVLRKAKTNINSAAGRVQGPQMWEAFWKRFGEADPATALAKAVECKDLTYTNNQYREKHVFLGMARKDPVAAAAAFLAREDLANRNLAIEGLMVEWTRQDIKAASAWAQQNLEGDAFKTATYAAAWGAAKESDISGGLSFLASLGENVPHDSAIRSLKSQVAQKPYLPANQLLEVVAASRTHGMRDRNFERQMASRATESDPFAAANFFAQPLADGSANDFAELRLVSAQWVRRDQKAAEAWAKGQEGTPFYPFVAAEFASAATERNDAEGAQRWLELSGAKEPAPR